MLVAERARANEPAPPAAQLAGLHLTPALQWRPVGPQFHGRRAAMWGGLLHALPVAVMLFWLRGYELPPPPVEPALELVIDKSAYVGSGPQVVTPAQPPQPVHQPEPQKLPQAAPAATVPVPPPLPPPLPPLAQTPDAMPLPPPLPPPPLPPRPVPATHFVPHPLPRPAPHMATQPALPAAAAPTPPPPPPHVGDDQPAGNANAYGRMILASPNETFNKKPPYPEEARAHGEQGRVLLSIHVGANGRALGVQVISSSGYAILDDAARDAVLGWVYTPAQLHGLPVDSFILFPILFQLDSP